MILNWKLRELLPELRPEGRLNVLIALLLHSNLRLRCWPGMDLLIRETGFYSEAVTAAKKWLLDHRAMVLVPLEYRQDEECDLPLRQHVYQLTGVIVGDDGSAKPYLYLTPEARESVDRVLANVSLGNPSAADVSTSNPEDGSSIEDGSSSKLSPAGAGVIPTLDTEEEIDESDWMNTPPQVVNVPMGGKKADREAYSERCDMCQANLSQRQDVCPVCGRPVEWHNSLLADKRAKIAKGKAADEAAKHKRENESRLSKTTAIVLALARATAVTKSCEFKQGEEQSLFQYEQAYGAAVVEQTANQLKADGDKGRGLIDHLVNYLARYNPSREKKPKAGRKQISDGWEE